MLSKIAFFFIVVIAGMIGLHQSLANGSFLRFLDEHPNESVVPAVEYYVGQGYYLLQDLDDARVYFLRVTSRYPASFYADDGMFYAAQILDDKSGTPRETLITEYQKYVDRFPKGKHLEIAQGRVSNYQTNR